MAPRRAIGLFGGSFNPVHSGHVLLARHARKALGLDEVWLIPCARSADRKALAPGALRLRWLRLALRGEEGLKASDIELKRGGVSRTVDTLRQLRCELGEGVAFTVLLGQDQALRLPRWKDAVLLTGLCRLAVFRRSGVGPDLGPGFRPLNAPLFDISSSDIRARIRARRSVGLLLPPALVRDRGLMAHFGRPTKS